MFTCPAIKSWGILSLTIIIYYIFINKLCYYYKLSKLYIFDKYFGVILFLKIILSNIWLFLSVAGAQDGSLKILLVRDNLVRSVGTHFVLTFIYLFISLLNLYGAFYISEDSIKWRWNLLLYPKNAVKSLLIAEFSRWVLRRERKT